MATVLQEKIHSYPPSHAISWGAVVAGLTFIFALSWLLLTLGSAIGLSLSDASGPYHTEPERMVLSLSPFAWAFISNLIAFFLGGLLTGRLAGRPDRVLGMLHGVTVWANAVIVSLILGSFGIGGITISSMNVARTGESLRDAERPATHVPPDSMHINGTEIDRAVMPASEAAGAFVNIVRDNGNTMLEYAAGTHWLVFVSNAAALLLAVLGSSIGAASVARMVLFKRY